MRLDLEKMKMYFLTCNNPTRREHFLNEFKGYDVTEVHPVIDIPRYQSGSSGFSRMLDLGARNQDRTKPFQPFAIFEDDVKHFRDFPSGIDIPDDADILYIGVSLYGSSKYSTGAFYDPPVLPYTILYDDIDDHLIKVYNMCSTHGLIVCSAGGLLAIQKCMMESYFLNIGWDIHLSQIQPYYNVYALKHPLVYQYEPLGGYEMETKVIIDSKYAQQYPYDKSLANTTNASILACAQQF